MPGHIIFQKMIYRSDLQNNPDVFYVFGDNMARKGLGGQAKEMRDEPNAIGVPTKLNPTHFEQDYLKDGEISDNVMGAINDAFFDIEEKLNEGRVVVFPTDGLGTGIAKLPTRAPKLLAYIDARIEGLIERYKYQKSYQTDVFSLLGCKK